MSSQSQTKVVLNSSRYYVRIHHTSPLFPVVDESDDAAGTIKTLAIKGMELDAMKAKYERLRDILLKLPSSIYDADELSVEDIDVLMEASQ